MALKNFCLAGTPSVDYVYARNEAGAVANVSDGDTNTAHEVKWQLGGEFDPTYIEVVWEVAFAETATHINSLSVTSQYWASLVDEYVKMYLYYNAQWNEVWNLTSGMQDAKTTYTKTDGNWYDVSKAKLHVYRKNEVYFRCFEIQASGYKYEDIGLKYKKGASTYRIAVEALSATDKLRIRKGSTTYGVSLAATDYAMAAPLRVYDGSAVKALVKLD